MRITAGMVVLFILVTLSLVAISAQDSKQSFEKSARTSYPDNIDGLHDFLGAFIAAIKDADLEKRARMEESLHLPDPQEWFVKTYGPNLGQKMANDYVGELHEYLDRYLNRQDLEPSIKLQVSRVEFATKQAAHSSEIPLLRVMSHPVPFYTAYLSWGDDDNLGVVYPLFVYVQGGFRTVHRQFGRIDESDRPHCGLEHLLLHRFQVGGGTMKQKLLRPVPPVPFPPGARQSPTTVKLLVSVGCDGSVLETDYLDGPPELFKPANDAVKKWKYGQTFMNGVPAEVDTTATVAFGSSH